jgi:hypothetical protein
MSARRESSLFVGERHPTPLSCALIVDLDSLLLPGGRVGEYQLHAVSGENGVPSGANPATGQQKTIEIDDERKT